MNWVLRLLLINAMLGGIDVLHCPLALIDKPLIEAAHAQNLMIHAADCDTEESLRRAFRLGVDQLSTNELETAILLRDTIL